MGDLTIGGKVMTYDQIYLIGSGFTILGMLMVALGHYSSGLDIGELYGKEQRKKRKQRIAG